MQIRPINITQQQKLQKDSRNNNNLVQNTNITNQQTPSFKGGLDSFCLLIANIIENGGLFVSFTLQDMLGTNLPRPIMGLFRNAKENKGEKNKSFAAKELVREMLTGPSMFLIPMGLLKVGKPVIGKTMNVPMKEIKALGNIHAANPLNAMGEAISKQDFYKNTFTEIIKNAKAETTASEATIKKAGEFAEKLAASLTQGKDASKKAISELSDDFVNIAKQHASNVAHTDFTVAKLAEGTKVPFKDSINSMLAYADDVVGKIKGRDSSKIQGIIKKITNQKVLTRFGTNVVMYAAILAFLRIIPKLYNKAEGKDNAGLKGLMKEETLKNQSTKEKTNKNVLEEKLNKSNPSFGKSNPSFGSAAMADKAVSTLLNGKASKAFNAFEFSGFNVSFPMLLGIMGLGVLLPRIQQAKDKYDREEILRRDLVTCAVMCFGEKGLQKGFSKFNEANSGFVLTTKDAAFKDKSLAKKFFDYIRPIKGVNIMKTEQIVSKYTNIDQYKGGIKGFCEFISGNGGKLGKIFDLTDESRSIVNGLLQKEGKTLANADNQTITRVLDSAKDSTEVKKLIELFKKAEAKPVEGKTKLAKFFNSLKPQPVNPWVDKARTLNARFTALSVLVLVPVFLGFMLPAINERATKKRIREEQEASEKLKLQQFENINPSFFAQTKQNENIFTDMQNFTK